MSGALELRRAPDSRILAAWRSVQLGNHDGQQGWFVVRMAGREPQHYDHFLLSALADELERRNLGLLRVE